MEVFYYLHCIFTQLVEALDPINPTTKFGNLFYPSVSHLFNSYMQEI